MSGLKTLIENWPLDDPMLRQAVIETAGENHSLQNNFDAVISSTLKDLNILSVIAIKLSVITRKNILYETGFIFGILLFCTRKNEFNAEIYHCHLAPMLQGVGFASYLINAFEKAVIDSALKCNYYYDQQKIRLYIDTTRCTERYDKFWISYGFKKHDNLLIKPIRLLPQSILLSAEDY